MNNQNLDRINNELRQENERHKQISLDLEKRKNTEQQQHATTTRRLKDKQERVKRSYNMQTDEEFEPEMSLYKELIQEIKRLLEENKEDED